MIVLSLTVSQNLFVKQLDFNNEFMNGDFQEAYFMSQPQYYESKNLLLHLVQITKGTIWT